MRSIFSKLAVAAFITIGFITQETQSVQIRNLVHAQRSEMNAHPNIFAEVMGSVTVPGNSTASVPKKEAPKVTSQPANVSGPAPKAPTTNNTSPAANNQPAKTTTTTTQAPSAPAQTAPA